MFGSRHVWLAMHNLTFQPITLLGYSLGVGFAVLLMFVQYGILHALLESNVQLIRLMDADLILLSPQQSSVGVRETISGRRLTQASEVAGVRDVRPLYVEYHLSELSYAAERPTPWRAPRSIRVIGIDPETPELRMPELAQFRDALGRPGAALFDVRSKPDPDHRGHTVFGDLRVNDEVELAGRRLRLVGKFALGSDSLADGTLIVSRDTFGKYLRRPFFSGDPSERVEFGLVRVKDPKRIEEVRTELRELLPAREVEVVTRAELIAREKAFWQEMTPVGMVFGFGAWVGFLVGLVVCIQILVSDVVDHLPEYATLRAMGYGWLYLISVVCQEAGLLTLFGYLPGALISWIVFGLLAWSTGLTMDLVPHLWPVFWRTALICALAGTCATYKAMTADPAEVFG